MKKNIIFALAALALMGCSSKETTATQEDERVEQVRTTVLQPREIEREISVSTNLQGYLTQNVAPSLTGKIEHIYCEVGDKVSKGTDLVRMDQTQYKTTKISMANLEVEKNRITQLLRSGSATQQQYDQITTHPAYMAYVDAKDAFDALTNAIMGELQFAITGQRPCAHDCSSCASKCH